MIFFGNTASLNFKLSALATLVIDLDQVHLFDLACFLGFLIPMDFRESDLIQVYHAQGILPSMGYIEIILNHD